MCWQWWFTLNYSPYKKPKKTTEIKDRFKDDVESRFFFQEGSYKRLMFLCCFQIFNIFLKLIKVQMNVLNTTLNTKKDLRHYSVKLYYQPLEDTLALWVHLIWKPCFFKCKYLSLDQLAIYWKVHFGLLFP